MTGQSASKSHLGCLFCKRLDQAIFRSPFQPGLLRDSDTVVVFAISAFVELWRDNLVLCTPSQFDAFLNPFNKHAFSGSFLRAINTQPGLVSLWPSSCYSLFCFK